eukprot:scaffold11298_cov50-Attheya_sp.AAC.3
MPVQEISGAHATMVQGCVMFGKVICQISSAFPPVDMELAFCSSILEPVKAHVDGFGAALFDCVIDDASRTAGVDLKGCRWLGMAHFFQDDTEDDSFAGIEETRAEFCFGGGGQDDVEDGA